MNSGNLTNIELRTLTPDIFLNKSPENHLTRALKIQKWVKMANPRIICSVQVFSHLRTNCRFCGVAFATTFPLLRSSTGQLPSHMQTMVHFYATAGATSPPASAQPSLLRFVP